MNEPTHDPEIRRWFEGLGPPPEQQAPTHLQAKVRARILHQQRPAGFIAWMSRFGHPVWATVLAAVLVLSLSANLWWGLEDFTRKHPAVVDRESAWAVYPFLAQLPRNEVLQTAVAARAAIEPEWIGRGFVSGEDPRVAFFRMGTLYADASAALHSQLSDAAEAHLRRLIEALRRAQAPTILLAYLHEIMAWIQHSSYTEAELMQLLALFEPLYTAAYGGQDDGQAVSVFQIAAWLENLVLALDARAHIPQQQPAILDIYLDALLRFRAPTTVIDAFKQIRTLVTQTAMSQAERRQLRRAIETIQHLLGAMTG